MFPKEKMSMQLILVKYKYINSHFKSKAAFGIKVCILISSVSVPTILII